MQNLTAEQLKQVLHYDIDTGLFYRKLKNGILKKTPTVTGGLTSTIPTAPNPKVQVCAVVYQSASNGSLFVRPAFGGILGQYEGDVNLPSMVDSDLLVRNAATGTWVASTTSTTAVDALVDVGT